jgi:hypothetical protein
MDGGVVMNLLAQFEYKCRRCGGVIDGPATARKNGSSVLVNVVTEAKPEDLRRKTIAAIRGDALSTPRILKESA